MKKHLLIVMLMLISLALCPAQSFGDWQQQIWIKRIPTSLNDAQLAADALGAINYEVTHLQDLNYDEMLKALDGSKPNFAPEIPRFSICRIHQTRSGRNYLIPNAQNVGKTEQFISVDVVLESLSRATNSLYSWRTALFPGLLQ